MINYYRPWFLHLKNEDYVTHVLINYRFWKMFKHLFNMSQSIVNLWFNNIPITPGSPVTYKSFLGWSKSSFKTMASVKKKTKTVQDFSSDFQSKDIKCFKKKMCVFDIGVNSSLYLIHIIYSISISKIFRDLVIGHIVSFFLHMCFKS